MNIEFILYHCKSLSHEITLTVPIDPTVNPTCVRDHVARNSFLLCIDK